MKKQQITIFGGIIIFSILLILFVSQNEFSRFSSENNVSENMISGFEANHGFIKDGLAGNIQDDSSDYVTGKQSLKITTNGNEKQVIITNNAIEPKIDFNEKFLKMWIKINDTSKINNLKMVISGDNFLTQKTYWVHNQSIYPIGNVFGHRSNKLVVQLVLVPHKTSGVLLPIHFACSYSWPKETKLLPSQQYIHTYIPSLWPSEWSLMIPEVHHCPLHPTWLPTLRLLKI